ncbi:glycosyltransferase family 2 protein [Mucilaginibacter rubeus]|uniref:Glycosyltransferase family 2 protein n=1 Tax=Mucilaginibacter rubeus TaxID=2027860 RepID=A0A5C1I2I0_9SPHI|nr:glycosyltransferase family 2 protein [Mucilaginibacter rubeus]QEM11411.1 glycosyltransferase family 2 protein [Mucilaginibacter rubeus]
MSDLAIIIPAYKKIYFDQTLASLAAQSNKNFTVYIGDDCSPEDLSTIVERYREDLNIIYTRFENNIGAKDLVLQWERCLALSKTEKWICLFSDDDLMDSNCVEEFYSTVDVATNDFDIFRFNTVVINQHGEITNQGITGPQTESSAQMAYNLLHGRRGNSMPDHIFSRRIYEECGGFVFTRYAQGADWALSILFSRKKGMFVIPNAKVYWRYSGLNISSNAARNKNDMIGGHLDFISWALIHFEYLKTTALDITYQMIVEALRFNLKMVMLYHYNGFNYKQAPTLLSFYHDKLQLSYRESIRQMMEINGLSLPNVHTAKRVLVKLRDKMFKRS